MSKKYSLSLLDRMPLMQAQVSRNAMLFAQLSLQDAKKHNLTREQMIREKTKK